MNENEKYEWNSRLILQWIYKDMWFRKMDEMILSIYILFITLATYMSINAYNFLLYVFR